MQQQKTLDLNRRVWDQSSISEQRLEITYFYCVIGVHLNCLGRRKPQLVAAWLLPWGQKFWRLLFLLGEGQVLCLAMALYLVSVASGLQKLGGGSSCRFPTDCWKFPTKKIAGARSVYFCLLILSKWGIFSCKFWIFGQENFLTG